jgi:hypothetical protein
VYAAKRFSCGLGAKVFPTETFYISFVFNNTVVLVERTKTLPIATDWKGFGD